MEIESSRYGVNNTDVDYHSTFIVSEGTTINITASNYGIYNYDSTFIMAGTATINATGSSSYGLYTYNCAFTVSEGATIDITASVYGIYTSGSETTFIVSEGATINVTASTRGLENYSYATVTVNGTVAITTKGTGVSNSGTINGSGTITVNGEPYDGSSGGGRG